MDQQPMPSQWQRCSNSAEWRHWLYQNHRQAKEVWLEIRKVNSSQGGVTLSEAVSEALCFGWIDGKMRRLDSESYILRFTPRQSGSLWSRINRQRAEALLAAGRIEPAGLAAIQEAKATGHWQSAYTSLEKPYCPADLSEALQAEPAAVINFNNWSNSDQLMATSWIEQSKRSQTRQKRIKAVVAAARNNSRLFSGF